MQFPEETAAPPGFDSPPTPVQSSDDAIKSLRQDMNRLMETTTAMAAMLLREPRPSATAAPLASSSVDRRHVEDVREHGAQREANNLLVEENRRPESETKNFLGFPQTQWRPTSTPVQFTQEQIIQLFHASTEAAVQAVTSRRMGPVERLLPTFSALEWEDPQVFLEELSETFQEQNVEPRNQLRMALAQLGGEAKKTFEPWRTVKMDFAAFRERLLARFNDPATLGGLRSRLHGEKQKDDEPAAVFIRRKMGLHQRVEPYTSEEWITCEVRELLRPEIRYAICTGQERTLEELSRAAERAETSFKGLQKVLKPQTAPRQTPNMATERTPPSPCRTCQGWHFNRDCPHREERQRPPQFRQMVRTNHEPSENSRRAEASQGARPESRH